MLLSQMRQFTGETRIALTLALIAGCGETGDQGASSNEDRPKRSRDDQEDFALDEASLRANVGRRLSGCEGIRDACRSDAGLAPPSDECKDELEACFSEVVEEALKFFEALHECQKTAVSCVEDGEDRATCRSAFNSCVEGVLKGDAGADGWSSHDGGTKHDAGSRTSTPRGGGVVTPPSLDGGTRSTSPGRSSSDDGTASDACIEQLQACAESGTEAEACAESATACIDG